MGDNLTMAAAKIGQGGVRHTHTSRKDSRNLNTKRGCIRYPSSRLRVDSVTRIGANRVLRKLRSSRRGLVQVMASTDMPAIIVGGGRIGNALSEMGDGNDVIVRRDSSISDAIQENKHLEKGPIYVCTRNDVLNDVVENCPEHRREDLVFLQNGMLIPWLEKKGLGANTQALIYMAVSKLGEKPTDGITDMEPEGLTSATGKWADALQARLKKGDMSCHVLGSEEFMASMFEKLIWISSFMLIGAKYPGATVGDVESKYTEEVVQLIEELSRGVADTVGVKFKPQVAERLCAYARSVSHFPTAVKEFEWRNGYFHQLTKQQVSDGKKDPFPTHTSLLEDLDVVKPIPKFALLFDCDGVIVETEELHRLAYNKSFEALNCMINGVPVEWTVAYYDVLQNTVGGGKPKMKWHFGKNGWPVSDMGPPPSEDAAQNTLVDVLQDRKTVEYKKIVEEIAKARPGVVRLMEEGLSRGDVAMAICSAATRAGFEKVVHQALGEERLNRFDEIIAGDDVSVKKPDPMIYNVARKRLGVPKERCVVIEDSIVGLRAATSAGMPCIITPTSSNSTSAAEFIKEGAVAVVETLGDDPAVVTAAELFPKDSNVPVFPSQTVSSVATN